MVATTPSLRVWIDPACPWAWETSIWLRELRDAGQFSIRWELFSLELNSAAPNPDFWDASALYGEAHAGLVLAGREGGDAAFEALYIALGRRLHEQREDSSAELFRDAATDAGMEGIVDRALQDPRAPHQVVAAYQAAREADVFGVPTLSINGSKVLYGPIVPRAPTGHEALEWWAHVRWLMERPDFFELKRWPRDIRPGTRT